MAESKGTWASWRTALSNGCSALGTALAGIGTTKALVDLGTGAIPTKLIIATTLSGFFISAIGKFLNGMVARDDVVVSENAGAVIDPAQTVVNVKTGHVTPPVKTE